MTRNVVKDKKEPTNDFLSGRGEVTRLVRTFDWTKSDLGPASGWPQSRRPDHARLALRDVAWLGTKPHVLVQRRVCQNDARAKASLGLGPVRSRSVERNL